MEKFSDQLYWATCIDQNISPRKALNDYSESLLEDVISKNSLAKLKESALTLATTFFQFFIQENFSGPPTGKTLGEILELSGDIYSDPLIIDKFVTGLQLAARDIIVEECGEETFPLLEHLPCLLIARYLFIALEEPLWIARVLFIQQRVCMFASEYLEKQLLTAIDGISVDEDDVLINAELYLFKALVYVYYHMEKPAHSHLELAQKCTGLKWNVTGRLGKRTKYQKTDFAQLTLEVSTTPNACDTSDIPSENGIPKTLPLEDDTLLDGIKFIDEDHEPGFKSLSPIDQCILMAYCQDYRLRNPKDDITAEQMNPFLEAVIANPSNFSIHTNALYMRSKLDATRKRKVERALLQIQALVDQFPLTDSSIGGAAYEVRVKYFWSILFPLRTEMQSELAKMFLKYGMARSALEIYLLLQRWEEVIHCYIVMDEYEKAEKCVMEQLDKPETPKPLLYCIMGDLKKDAVYYEKAWEVSGCRYARAMRSLGSHYFKIEEYSRAIECYDKALSVNALYENAWFTLGCAAMQMENWVKSQEAFIKCIQMDESNGEAWNNLAAINIKLGKKSDAFKCLRTGLKEKYENWKMWENFLFLSIELGEFSESIYAITRLIDLNWKDRNSVDVEAIRVLVYHVGKLHIEIGEPTSKLVERLRNVLNSLTNLHTMFYELWMIKSDFHSGIGETEEVLKSLQSANRACQVAGDQFYDIDQFEKAGNVALKLADAYIAANEAGIISDGLFQARILLRRVLKLAKDGFEGHELYTLLQTKYEENK